jgi:hypothetical protein
MDPDHLLLPGFSRNAPNKKPRISPPLSRTPEISQEENFNGNTNEGIESDIPELKDEAELKLESLIFGDQAAFHDALNTYDPKSNRRSNFLESPEFRGDSFGDGECDGDGVTDAFAGVPDADVSLSNPTLTHLFP